MTISKAFFIFFLSFILGIFLRSFFLITLRIFLFFIFFFIFFFFLSFLLDNKKFLVFSFSFLFLILGIFRYHIEEMSFLKEPLFNFQNQKVILRGQVIKEIEEGEKSDRVTLETKEIFSKENKWEKINGKILLYAEKYSQINYGDILEIKGELKEPPVFEGFNYRNYLKKDKITSVVYFPEIKILEKNQGNYFLKIILSFKSKLKDFILENLSPPKSTILEAIILGEKKEIYEELSEKLNKTGLRHIVAISGLHFTILAAILMSFFISLGFWRGQAFYLTIIFLIFYLLIIGFQPSATRAFIMSFLFLYGQKIGRLSSSYRALVFAAFLMLIFNPFLLRFDIGFQLSFLAVFGIISFSSFINEKLKFLPNFLKDILSFTISAQTFTLPLILYNFGYFSIVSPLTNILVLPILPFLMGFGFLFSFLGIFFPLLGKILSFFSWIFLTYLTKIIDFFSSLSFSSLNFRISWIWLPISYLILGFFIFIIREKEKLKFLRY